MSTKKNQETGLPQNITCSWLWKNIPIRWWWTFFGLLFGAFSLGIYVTGIPSIKNMLRYVPGYKVDLVLPAKTTEHIEKQITKLVESHNSRLSKLQEQFLYEERLGGDHNLIRAWQEPHKEASQRIQKLIHEENQNFQNELKSLKSIFE